MSNVANATFGLVSWDEAPYDEVEGELKLARANVSNEYHGDIEGTSSLVYLMAYLPAGTASFIGHERVAGRLGDRNGSFILRHVGTHANGAATATVTVVPGSGTGDLAGLTGQGTYTATHVQPTPVRLEYTLE